VFIAVATTDDVAVKELALDGGPDEVLDQTVSHCLALVEQTLSGA
jgi:hypothetical protein